MDHFMRLFILVKNFNFQILDIFQISKYICFSIGYFLNSNVLRFNTKVISAQLKLKIK